MILFGIFIILIITSIFLLKKSPIIGDAFGVITLVVGIVGLIITLCIYSISRASCNEMVIKRASMEQSIKNARENNDFIEQAALVKIIIDFNTELALGQSASNKYLLKDFYTEEYRQLKPLK